MLPTLSPSRTKSGVNSTLTAGNNNPLINDNDDGGSELISRKVTMERQLPLVDDKYISSVNHTKLWFIVSIICISGFIFGYNIILASIALIKFSTPSLKHVTNVSKLCPDDSKSIFANYYKTKYSDNVAIPYQAIINASVCLGAAFGSLLLYFHPLLDAVGRKWLLILSKLILFFAVLIACLLTTFNTQWSDLVLLIFVLLLLGISTGIDSCAAPLLLTELCPRFVRAKTIAFYQLTILIGIVFGTLIGSYLFNDLGAHSGYNHGWCWSIITVFVPALLQLVLLIVFVPASPRWLLLKYFTQRKKMRDLGMSIGAGIGIGGASGSISRLSQSSLSSPHDPRNQSYKKKDSHKNKRDSKNMHGYGRDSRLREEEITSQIKNQYFLRIGNLDQSQTKQSIYTANSIIYQETSKRIFMYFWKNKENDNYHRKLDKILLSKKPNAAGGGAGDNDREISDSNTQSHNQSQHSLGAMLGEYSASKGVRPVQDSIYNSIGLKEFGQIKEKIGYIVDSYDTNPFWRANIKYLLITGILLNLFQQFCGFNMALYESKILLCGIKKPLGFIPSPGGDSGGAANEATAISYCLNAIVSLIVVLLIDKFEYKQFIFAGIGIMLVSFVATIIQNNAFHDNHFVVPLSVYMGGFFISLGPFTWIITTELFPINVKSKYFSLCIAVQWIGDAILASNLFIYLFTGWGAHDTLLPLLCGLFAIVLLLTIVFVARRIPKTKTENKRNALLLEDTPASYIRYHPM